VPRAARPHIAAIYAFARGADDIADEGSATPDRRIALLDQWRAWLHDAARGELTAAGEHTPVFVALAHTLRTCALPVSLCDDLLSAFRQDVLVERYATWADVLDYCRRSANPIGRLVLRICGYRRPELDEASDCICTALQLTNFWQDLSRDWTIGRLYVPEDVWRNAGARLEDFDPEKLSPGWCRALERVMTDTRALFDEGRHICDGVNGRLRYELRLTWLGGMRILDRVQKTVHDGAYQRPALGVRDAGPILWGTLTWTARNR
jgi:squalene synthase HpnC